MHYVRSGKIWGLEDGEYQNSDPGTLALLSFECDLVSFLLVQENFFFFFILWEPIVKERWVF